MNRNKKYSRDAKHGRWRFVLLVPLIYALMLPAMVSAKGGLRTKFSMVTLQNLQPGETYNIRELVNLPLNITNTGDSKVTVRMDVNKPEQISGAMAQGHFEPIPDVSWVNLGQHELVVNPGETAGTDVIIKVPDDDIYLNKRYQADIHIRTVESQFVNVGLLANLRFSTVARRLTKEELERRKKVQAYGNKIDFDLLPNKGFIEALPLGKEVDTEKVNKVALKISNPNETDFTYYLDVVYFGEVEMPMLEGYSDLPDLSWVKLQGKEVKVPPDSIKKIKMTIKIPAKEEYRGKKYAFAVKATVSGTPLELNQVSRFYVSTEK